MLDTMTSVLAIEDDPDLLELLRTLLSRNGYRVEQASSGRQGLRTFHESRPDMVVLDIGLPDLDGWQVLERIRDMSDAPVLVLTARSSEADKVRGFETGADDYLTKPFGRAELLARLQAMQRRHPRPDQHQVFHDGRLRVDMVRREVQVEGRPLQLTPIEYRLLVALVTRPDQVITNEELLEQAWNDPGGTPERIKYTILRLRRKLGWAEPETSPLESVRGFGYKYRTPA